MPRSTTPRPVGGPGGNEAAGLSLALVDGVPMFREGLSALVLRTKGLRWLGATDTPQGALQFAERYRPDVVLIDSGLDPRQHLSHTLSGANPDLAILILVRDGHRTTQYVATAIAAGVHGVLLRSAEPPQLLEAISATHRDRRYVDPALAATVAAPRARLAQVGETEQQPLSRREFQVLQLIADGLENQAIAKILYVSVETVRTHVKSILRKLSARDRTHAVAVAFKIGVLIAPPLRRSPDDGT
ncbi:two-component system response regulator [Actinokineospora spheciospongiae]|uniref:Two-component system response regulator n=1 Tax=Actinokineospora spheciospongiae TaxID=909613 RepID=W7IVE7_9PSEU|nr:response regulator transcription factor [Actinokineospora spheciospongiae]EWC60376.1 two-component system response regulator [Actinokineospora spheciospongiae]PWW61825.1 LuxR family two component transcriptional regulator [Actinokineospora spheciospongiae]